MRQAIEFLINDWRRKLVALAIGFALWSWIEGRIAVEREVILSVASTSEDIGTPADFELLIQAPDGWVLTEPMIGQPITVWLNGSESELQSFATRQCAASLKVDFSAPPATQVSVTIPIGPEELDWLRPRDAELLLKNVPEDKKYLKELVFQRVKSETIQLSSRDIDLIGQPSDAWMVKRDELRFEPNTVTITGPQRAVTRLRMRIDAAKADPTGDPSRLLNTFEIPGGTRTNVNRMQSLHLDLQREGIRMDPPVVKVFADIRMRNPVSLTLNRAFDDLHILPATDMSAWSRGSWEPQPWVVEMPDVEGDDEVINEKWITDHVILVLPLHLLDTTLATELNVRIEPHIFGFESEEKQRFYEQHLIIRPQTPGGDLIPYSKSNE